MCKAIEMMNMSGYLELILRIPLTAEFKTVLDALLLLFYIYSDFHKWLEISLHHHMKAKILAQTNHVLYFTITKTGLISFLKRNFRTRM